MAVDNIITRGNLRQLAEEHVSIELEGDLSRLEGNDAALYLAEKLLFKSDLGSRGCGIAGTGAGI